MWHFRLNKQNALQMVKEALCNPPVLALPDFTHEFVLECDIFDIAKGAVLSYDLGGGLQPV